MEENIETKIKYAKEAFNAAIEMKKFSSFFPELERTIKEDENIAQTEISTTTRERTEKAVNGALNRVGWLYLTMLEYLLQFLGDNKELFNDKEDIKNYFIYKCSILSKKAYNLTKNNWSQSPPYHDVSIHIALLHAYISKMIFDSYFKDDVQEVEEKKSETTFDLDEDVYNHYLKKLKTKIINSLKYIVNFKDINSFLTKYKTDVSNFNNPVSPFDALVKEILDGSKDISINLLLDICNIGLSPGESQKKELQDKIMRHLVSSLKDQPSTKKAGGGRRKEKQKNKK